MAHYGILTAGALCLALAMPPAGAAAEAARKTPAPALKGDPLAGRLKSDDERCQECHGHDGNANDIEDGVGNIGKFPRLAGQLPDYMVKQVRDFRSGERRNDIMLIVANSLNERDLADIAAYFASQKIVADKAAAAPLGRRLFAEGDAARGIPPCGACHGELGQGKQADSTSYPRLAGQHRRYLVKQLTEWRAGERANSPGRIMNSIAGKLSDAEIEQLANYLAGL